MFKVIDKNWQAEFTKIDMKGKGRLRVVSPFIKLGAAKTLISAVKPADIQVITRYKLKDFYEGVSDIEALEFLISKGAQVQGIKKLHSKLYFYGDQQALVTSANLTGGGFKSNFELGGGFDDEDLVQACNDYFDFLWDDDEAMLTYEETNAWKDKVEIRKVTGGKKKTDVDNALPDLGRQLTKPNQIHLSSTTSQNGAPAFLETPLGFQSFVKFLGEGDNRALRSSSTFHELESSGAHWSVGYPNSKAPRQPQDGDVMFIARMVYNPNDIIIFGRALAITHDEVRDVATPEDIAIHNWRSIWGNYIRVYDSEFLEGEIGGGVSLRELEGVFGANSYMSTQRNLINGNGNYNPAKAYQQAPGVQLTDVAHDWLNRKFNEQKKYHGIIDEGQISNLYSPTKVPSKYPRHFQIELKKTYYNNSYFNPPVKHGATLATGSINLYLGSSREKSEASAKRYLANKNNPRIFTDAIFQKWKKQNFNIGDILEVTIEGPNSIWLRKFGESAS